MTLNLATDFVDYSGFAFKPQARKELGLQDLFDQVVAWAEALRSVRAA